jgi:hypothetical protein
MRLQLRAALGLLALAGCGGESPIAEPPEVDRDAFEAEVYPILLRDCGFPACHGDRDRFFRVFGPGRTRLDEGTATYAAPTDEELDATFDRARSMLAAAPDPRQSLLLRKPLEASAGGGAHQGLDALGRNVYAGTDDPSWRILAAWAGAVLEEPDAGAMDAGPRDAPTDATGDAERTDAETADAEDAP